MSEIFQCMIQSGMQIKWSKFSFMSREGEVLDHKLYAKELEPSRSHVSAIKVLLEPRNVRQIAALVSCNNARFSSFI